MAVEKPPKPFDEFFCTEIVGKQLGKRLATYLNPNTFKPQGFKTSADCPVCNHILRPQVEEMLYGDVPHTVIAEWVEKMGYRGFDEKVLKKHAKEHCALLAASKELAQEKQRGRVQELSEDILAGPEALNLIINRFAELVEGGDFPKVSTNNLIKAVEVKHKIEGSNPLRDLLAGLFVQNQQEAIEGEVEEVVEIPGEEVEGDYEFFKKELEEEENANR